MRAVPGEAGSKEQVSGIMEGMALGWSLAWSSAQRYNEVGTMVASRGGGGSAMDGMRSRSLGESFVMLWLSKMWPWQAMSLREPRLAMVEAMGGVSVE